MDKLEERGGDGVGQKNLPALGKKTTLPMFMALRELLEKLEDPEERGGPEELSGDVLKDDPDQANVGGGLDELGGDTL